MGKSPKTYEEAAKKILSQMTLEEKAGLCSGSDAWHTKDAARQGVEKIMVTDGPHGLRKQAESQDNPMINVSVPSTCFPSATTTACSFDPALLEEIGAAMGEECLREDVSIILGPGINIKRSPLCGRNFEYFSEDPYLAGIMAGSLIAGVQSKGVGTSLKHYAANSQEARRMVIDAIIDERALREIYLAGFETAVKMSKPWTLMCSYNRVNGEYASENKKLLTEILRGEWGFEGAVMSDWGAVNDRVKGLDAGLDLEMPYAGPANDQAIIAAVREGRLAETVLDTAALRMLCILLASAENRRPGYQFDAGAHHAVARKAAASSAVLLKNEENILPFSKENSIAVIGAFAKTPRYQGAGSSRINPLKLDNICDVLAERGAAYEYAAGYDLKKDTPDSALVAEAVAAAKKAKKALVCIGLTDEYESEGFDRDHMRLPESHTVLLEKVAAANPDTVVLLFCGSPVEMPWAEKAKGILLLYLGGEAGAEAACDLVFGDVNPSGKLAETFPLRLEDNPSRANFPGGDKTVEYRESVYVGYRYYDAAEVNVRFPFGYGLSYTAFAYRDLELAENQGGVTARIKVKNTGKKAGAETVQFYVSQKKPSVFRPVRELKGFGKVYLEPGEEKTVSAVLGPRAFAWYSAAKKDWIVEAGEYTVAAAASSRDIRCEAVITLKGETVSGEAQRAEYAKPGAPLAVSAGAFENLYGKPLPPANRLPGEKLDMNSTIAEFAGTKTGGEFLAQVRARMPNTGGDETFSRMFERMMAEMPLRGMGMFGGAGPEEMRALVEKANAE